MAIQANSLTAAQATHVLRNQGYIEISDSSELFAPTGYLSRMKHIFGIAFRHEQMGKLVARIMSEIYFIEDRSSSYPVSDNLHEWRDLGEELIRGYRNDPAVRESLIPFDQFLAPYRAQLSYHFPENQQALARWQRAGQDPEIFRRFPDFVEFLEEAKILPYLRLSGDRAAIRESYSKQESYPVLLVNGEEIGESELKGRFKSSFAPGFKQNFLVNRDTNEVYTYLANRKGLEKYHPFLDAVNKPIATLSKDDYESTLIVAQTFERPEKPQEVREAPNAERRHIIQIVSSYTKGYQTNLHDVFVNASHPWCRLIEWDEESETAKVSEASFEWASQPFLPLQTVNGRFRAPDIWNMKHTDKKFVTNIAVTKDELDKFRSFFQKNHNGAIELGEKLGFRLDIHNCTYSIHRAFREIGIKLPTGVSAGHFFWLLAPRWIQNSTGRIQTFFQTAAEQIKRRCSCLVPSSCERSLTYILDKIKLLFSTIINILSIFIFMPLRILMGSAFGTRAKALGARPPGSTDPSGSSSDPNASMLLEVVEPEVMKNTGLHVPYVLQDWQKKQASTVEYDDKYLQYAIVPP